ncbi:hypothetical protein [Comamonas thiooxydans]|uniref:hypothetical protein n=1 Tax=Comamonas thiooxydans TaxID=363952 RepID=UPI000B418356|nr:hypothetical protein [Comamonas thiooxydans]
MQTNHQDQQSWSIHEALAVAFTAFTERFGADVLWRAFEELTQRREATLAQHAELTDELEDLLQRLLNQRGSELDLRVAKARTEADEAWLLLHAGVRWWQARDDLLSRPAHARVPHIYAEGMTDHVSLQLLKQVLYRGRAPYTTCD